PASCTSSRNKAWNCKPPRQNNSAPTCAPKSSVGAMRWTWPASSRSDQRPRKDTNKETDMKTWHPLLPGALLAAALAAAAPAAAQYPERPVKIIVSLPPGSGADTTARFLSKHLGDTFKQPFIVENRPGANSFIAAQAVVAAPPDGYTMFVASNSPMTTNAAVFKRLPYD